MVHEKTLLNQLKSRDLQCRISLARENSFLLLLFALTVIKNAADYFEMQLNNYWEIQVLLRNEKEKKRKYLEYGPIAAPNLNHRDHLNFFTTIKPVIISFCWRMIIIILIPVT